MPLTPGTMLGQYEILSPVGAGSMGEVYRARDTQLDREVAIKVLPDLVSSSRDRLLRFEQEAKAAAALNHPNILAVYQMGSHEGVPYLVSELLEGKTLAEAIRRGPLPLRKTLDYGIQIAQGLAAAHERGIVHRDLKPDNLFVTKEGRVKILDFGLAKLPEKKETSIAQAPTVTLPGVAMGTVGYMSPEQVRGQPTDHRTDIFALGAILYEMVMGTRSFHKPTEADTISAILNEEPPAISQLSPETPVGVERVIRRCLEKNPEQRFQSASDLAFALEALLDPSSSTSSGIHAIPRERPRRINRTYLAVALGMIALVAISAYWFLQSPAAPHVANYVQLTHEGQPKSLIGTDGTRLYLSLGEEREGSFRSRGVAQMSIAGGEPVRLANLPSVDITPVDLSPNGSEILAVNGQGAPPQGPLWSYSVLGGSPRRLGNFVAETAAWSPTARMIAFTNLRDLFVANADGSEPRQLAQVRGDISNVTWSPDGRYLRFDSSETAGTLGQQREWEVAADGTGLNRLLRGWHNPPNECCGRWTPDGKFFVFQSEGQIWALPKRGGFRSNSKPVQLTFSPLTLSSPIPGKDGKKLFMIGRIFRGELTRYDAKSKQFVPFLGGISGEFADFSKDGQWVAYVSYRDGALWRSKLDGSQRLQLTYPPMYAVLPRWSPDGKKIIFFEFAVTADKPARMYELSPDGGVPQMILPDDPSQQFDPNWSPDGTKIVFAGESNDPSSAIHILDLASKKVSDVPGSKGLYSPRWSPDGHHLSAFSGDSKTILLFDFASGKWTPLATGSLGWLCWSHDSQYIYLQDFSAKEAIVRIRVRDHQVEPVADMSGMITTGRYGAALALAPDDSPLLLRDTGSQDVYSVDWEE
jgi:eukaryotic-like serine/threonine-protein kinase